MATVKKAAVKKTVAAPAPRPVVKPKTLAAEVLETEAQLADAYLADRVYGALLELGESAKISEITLEIDNSRITFPLVRRALDDAGKFHLAERQWSLAARYLDTSRPVERNLMDIVRAAGRPLDRITLATELSEVYGRDASNFFALIDKVGAELGELLQGKVGRVGTCRVASADRRRRVDRPSLRQRDRAGDAGGLRRRRQGRGLERSGRCDRRDRL